MTDPTTVNANINSADCILVKSHFGQDIVHNICNGTQQTIEWGAGSYAEAIAIGFTIFALIMFVIAATIGLTKLCLGHFDL